MFNHFKTEGRLRSQESGRQESGSVWYECTEFMTDTIVKVVSGSMEGTPMEVSVALGIYLSERNVGPFKDGFITFSANPKLQILNGTLSQRVSQLARSQWDMNTNLESVFKLILSTAKKHGLSNRDLPKNIIILSDMQFDRCVYGSSKSAMDMIRSMYSSAGYTVPNVIFWNLRTSTGVPVKSTESGVALVSGFSPSIMKTLLGGNTNPMKVMLSTLSILKVLSTNLQLFRE